MLHLPRRAAHAAVLLFAALSAACDDLPSGPRVWTREAVGRRWVAVAEPVGLPGARAWLAWSSPATQDSVRAMLALAAQDWRAGRIEVALAGQSRAAELAAASLVREPDAVTVLSALSALDEWADRAADPAASGRFPELARDREEILALRASAAASLAGGDARGASLTATRAAAAARQWTPVAVAASAVVQAELAIAADPDPSPELLNARRLLRGAREGLASGDHTRALQRALYALQLIDHSRRR